MQIMKITYISVAAISGLILFGAGCSNSNNPSTAAPTGQTQATEQTQTEIATGDALHACDYLTPEIAAHLIGPVKEPKENNSSPTVSTCTYGTSGDKIGAATLLMRRSLSDAEAMTNNTGAEAESKKISGVDPVTIPDLGDHAYWAGGNLNQLNVFRGRDWFIISAYSNEYNKDKAIEIMKEILAKD